MKIKTIIRIAALALFITGQAHALPGITPEEVVSLPPTKVEQRLPDAHPAAYLRYAKRVWDTGKKDDAVFWYYLGQLRFRFFLAANPGLPPDEEPALFAGLRSEIGAPISEYAGSNLDNWVKQLDRVLAWDAAQPNGFTSVKDYQSQWQRNRKGLQTLRAKIVADAATLRAERQKAGLPNN